MATVIQQISKTDRKSLERFAALERKLLTAYPLYVSNFDDSIIRHLTGRSPTGSVMQSVMFVAKEGDSDVARCAALINPRFQAAQNEKVGFIGYFAAAARRELSVTMMLETAESWLKERGVHRVIAPFNGNPLLGYAFLTDGFDEEPVMFCSWNPPYYPAYLTQSGYQPKYPMLVYTTDFSSDRYRAAKQRAAAIRDVHLRPINKKQWRSELEIFRELVNENFDKEWLWYPFTQEEFADGFQDMKTMIDPRQMVIAEVQGKPAGVVIAFPNWNPLIRSFHGKVGNLQKLQFLLRGNRYATGGTAIVAVRSEYRGRWIGPALKMAVFQRYEELGMKKAYGYTIDADNIPSQKMNEAVGAVPRLMYHAYDKVIG